mgnify:FL=1
MIEEQQVVSSTAQLDSPQETAAEEVNVVNESPSEEGGSDNMSLNELTTQLLVEDEKQEESGESEVEQTTEEETPLQTEPEAEEQPNLVEQADEGENDERQVLERYGIDLDNLGEDDAISLGKALRTESLKRFGRLTAQKREAEAKIAELEGKATTVTESRVTQEDDPLSDVWTAETLQKKEADLQTIEDWAEDSLQLEAQYDDDGEEYLVETDGKKYTKQDLLGIRSNARKMLRKGGALDKRSQFLADRQNFDGQALQFFPWMSDESSPEYGEYQQFVTQEKYKKILDSIPEANVFAGLVVEGNLRVRERNAKASNGNGKAPKERAVTPALADAAAPKRAMSGDNSRIQKQVKQARQNFERSGSIAALATLRELQGKMS